MKNNARHASPVINWTTLNSESPEFGIFEGSAVMNPYFAPLGGDNAHLTQQPHSSEGRFRCGSGDFRYFLAGKYKGGSKLVVQRAQNPQNPVFHFFFH